MRRIECGSRQPFSGGARDSFGPHGQSSALRDRAVLHSRHYGERQRSISPYCFGVPIHSVDRNALIYQAASNQLKRVVFFSYKLIKILINSNAAGITTCTINFF